MSLDSLDDIYLGLDNELNTDSESSAGPDVLNEIPNLYLGPKDDLIEFDDALALVQLYWRHPYLGGGFTSLKSATPRHQMPEPPLNNEELHVMIQKFMPIESYHQTEIVDHLGDYQQHYGHIPDTTIAQLLEADRLFWMA
ncbi:hypothetical protein EDD22DRAFT_849173 [Suillus occidentalis]|nr:hypothetical protein EDD22DRAFT_849173 [Suillus occidentalis]